MIKKLFILIFFPLVFLYPENAGLTPGWLDNGFNPGSGANLRVYEFRSG